MSNILSNYGTMSSRILPVWLCKFSQPVRLIILSLFGKPNPRTASSTSNTLWMHYEFKNHRLTLNTTLHKIAVNGCWRPALVKDQQQRQSFHQQSLSCLLKVGVPSPLDLRQRKISSFVYFPSLG